MSAEPRFVRATAGSFRSLIRSAALRPENRDSVLVDGHYQFTYPEVLQHIQEIQAFLRASGVQAADCITVELNNSVPGALAVLALLDAGNSLMTLPTPGRGARTVGHDVAHVGFCRWILSVSAVRPTADSPAVRPTALLSVRPNEQFSSNAIAPPEDDPCIFARTSGSLAAPKLVRYRQGMVLADVLEALRVRQFDASSRLALPTPIFHSFGLRCGLLAGFFGGASIDFQERSNLLQFFDREREFEPNIAYATPSLCEMLVRARRTPRPYRYIVTGGDRISESTFKRAEDLHGPLVSQYGTTEMGVIATGRVEMPFELRCSTVGTLFPGVEARIIAMEGTDQGALQVRAPRAFEGYVDLDGYPVQRPGAIEDGWYNTGDLAQHGPEGTLKVLGRCDLSVNRNGLLLPFADVENRLRELTGVEEAAVAAGPANVRGRSLVAFCVLRRGTEVSPSVLRATYAGSAPAFSVPDVVHIVTELPKLPNGKIDRRALAALADATAPPRD